MVQGVRNAHINKFGRVFQSGTPFWFQRDTEGQSPFWGGGPNSRGPESRPAASTARCVLLPGAATPGSQVYGVCVLRFISENSMGLQMVSHKPTGPEINLVMFTGSRVFCLRQLVPFPGWFNMPERTSKGKPNSMLVARLSSFTKRNPSATHFSNKVVKNMSKKDHSAVVKRRPEMKHMYLQA